MQSLVCALMQCIFEHSHEYVRLCAEVEWHSPGEGEGLGADWPGGVGVSQQAVRQAVKLRHVDEGQPDQAAVTHGQVISNAQLSD